MQKVGYITLVTPPDFIKTNNKSYCLINLPTKDKDEFTNQLNIHFPDENITIYLWDDEEHNSTANYQWKQDVYRTAETIIFKNDDQSFSILNKDNIKDLKQMFNSK